MALNGEKCHVQGHHKQQLCSDNIWQVHVYLPVDMLRSLYYSTQWHHRIS